MDDLNVSPMDTELVGDILKLIDSKFEGEFEITISKNHVYLGMVIMFTDEVKVEIIKEYIRYAIQAFGKDIIMSVNTPAI